MRLVSRVILMILVALGVAWLSSSGRRSTPARGRRPAESPDDFEARMAAMDPSGDAPKAADFEAALDRLHEHAAAGGKPYVEVTSGDLHRQVGGYPGRGNRMPTCCRVMRRRLKVGDVVLTEPARGVGANLTIRYQLQPAG
jgi:5-methylcytosine-specific restriction protein A